jgi:hypothetical protein
MRGPRSRLISTEYVSNIRLAIREGMLIRLMRVLEQVLAGDKDIGHLLPIPEGTMQLFDECKGQSS